jgi:hypothetical protein
MDCLGAAIAMTVTHTLPPNKNYRPVPSSLAVSVRMDVEPIQYRTIDEPIPTLGRPGRPAINRYKMFDLLGTMDPGQAVEVNRAKRSVQYYVQRFRLTIAPDSQFIIRPGAAKWTKVWRVK